MNDSIPQSADFSIQEVARLAGTTSRTLRHYGSLGLLVPTRVGTNGYRFYNADALARLQRILLLRELGLGLDAIGGILDGYTDDAAALEAHLGWLRFEKNRLDRRIGSVETTITKLRAGEPLMAAEMLDGFDHTAHKAEVEDRWGTRAYSDGNDWWNAKSADERAAFQDDHTQLALEWADAAARGADPHGPEALALARRQYDWLASVPGTPRDANGVARKYFEGLGDMYMADERFAANYGGVDGARFVSDAMHAFAAAHLS